MAIANAINEQTIGVCGFSGTAFTSSPATQHCVQIGGASTHLLVSVTNGTTGQFLGANTGAAPTWQTPSSFTPNSVLNFFDDFLGTTNASTALGTWSNSGGTYISTPTTDSSHPGIISNNAFSAASSGLRLGATGTNGNQMVLGGGAISLNWVIRVAALSDGTNTYTLRVGMGDTINADQVNGVYFEYTHTLNSGNWVGKTAAASSRTPANSAVAVGTANYVNLGITINAGATSVGFFVNGVQIANSPIAATIPTAAITPFIDIARSAGTIAANSVITDLFYMTQTLTTPR